MQTVKYRSGERSEQRHRCGFAAIVGRPNVGKSTLLNALPAARSASSARSRRPRGTASTASSTRPGFQMIFVDTPGLHAGAAGARNRNEPRGRAALGAADAVDPRRRRAALDGEDHARSSAAAARSSDRPGAQQGRQGAPEGAAAAVHRELHPARTISPRSCRCRRQARATSSAARDRRAHLPESPPLPRTSDGSLEQFQAAEIVREKLMLAPATSCRTASPSSSSSSRTRRAALINAVIWVERERPEQIVIGRRASSSRKSAARRASR